MRTICLSSSLKYKDTARRVIYEFKEMGIDALFPNLDSGLDKDNLDMQTMKRLCINHFCAIDKSEALYVINPNGYIGTFVKIEIGYATGIGKPIYYSEKTNELDLDSLYTDIIPIGKLEKFVEF